MRALKRVLLRRVVCVGTIAALLVAVVAVLDDPAAFASTSTSSMLTVGLDLSGTASGPIDFDPSQFTVDGANFSYDWPMYGGLLRLLPDGSYVPDLASKVTVTDPETIAIQIRSGEVFSDGTPFNAAAVKTGLQRNMATTNKGAFDPSLFDISAIDSHWSRVFGPAFLSAGSRHLLPAIGQRGVLHRLSDSGRKQYPLGAGHGGTIQVQVLGTGGKARARQKPQVLGCQKHQVNRHHICERSPGTSTGQFAGVRACPGRGKYSPERYHHVDRNSSLRVTSAPQDAQYLWMPICKSSGPLADVKVRQALSYAVNRVQINSALLSGKGEPAWTLYPSNSALYDKSLDQRLRL